MEKLLHDTLLYDFYADLLTDKQKDIYHLYFCEDLSLSEIGEKLGISRQAVNFSLKQARRSFDLMEDALGLVRRHLAARNRIDALRASIECKNYSEASKILDELSELI